MTPNNCILLVMVNCVKLQDVILGRRKPAAELLTRYNSSQKMAESGAFVEGNKIDQIICYTP